MSKDKNPQPKSKKHYLLKQTTRVVISGGFDPLHVGHISLIREASNMGYLIVIVNCDEFLIEKKGYVFMPESQRIEILKNIKGVDEVVLAIDKDQTVRKTLRYLAPNIFANGGDRKNIDDIPEAEVCVELECDMVFDVGNTKLVSSSEIINNVIKKKQPDFYLPWYHGENRGRR